jgi:hypothetical protein
LFHYIIDNNTLQRCHIFVNLGVHCYVAWKMQFSRHCQLFLPFETVVLRKGYEEGTFEEGTNRIPEREDAQVKAKKEIKARK